MTKRILALVLAVAMMITALPIFAFAATGVTYYDYDATAGKLVETTLPAGSYETLTAKYITDNWSEIVAGWYVIEDDINLPDEFLFVLGDVKFILADGVTMTVLGIGVEAESNSTFAVYAQSTGNDMGQIVTLGFEGGAGIGGGSEVDSGDISIYGGIINAAGGSGAAGIGCGYAGIGGNTSCGTISIYGGIINAVGGSGAAGIGIGDAVAVRTSSCDTISVYGGYVKAVAGGEEIAPISNLNSSCTATTVGNARYVNYAPVAAVEATCTKAGHDAYVKDCVSGNYYEEFPFTENGLIGNAEALAAIRQQIAAEEAAKLAAAKDDAIAALNDAAGENVSAAMTAILNDAKAAVKAAKTVETVAAAKTGWLHVIELQKAKELVIKELRRNVGEELSEGMAAVLNDAIAAVNAATTEEEVIAAKEAGLAAIALRDLKDQAILGLTSAAGPTPLSQPMAAVLNDAISLVNEAVTEEEVENATQAGLLSITLQKARDEGEAKALADAKTASKASLAYLVGDTPSEAMVEVLESAIAAVDAATTIPAVIAAEQVGLLQILAQQQLEELNKAKEDALKPFTAILEDDSASEALKAIAEEAVEAITNETNVQKVKETADVYEDYCEARETAEGLLSECEMTLASDEYSDEVKALVRKFMEALDEVQTIDDVQMTLLEYGPAIRLQDDRDKWLAKLTDLLPEEPSDAVTAIIEDAKELILYGEDSSVFDNVYDIARSALSRQLTAEANTKALEDLLKQTEEDLGAANDTIDELNNTVKSKEATIAEQQAALDTATEQLNAAKADLEKAKAQIVALETTTTEQAEALVQAEQQMKALQAEIERLKALLDDDPTNPTEPQPTETGTEPTATGTEPTATGAEETMLGDANGDGDVNMKDVLLMRKYLAEMDVEYNAQNADVNSDGDVNMKDVLMLRKFLAGLIETLGA